ncbi:MAG: hypothetical protein CL910_12820 [Deltaproteobacteria bacterium]|jgi:hypothetical protein|nr:hypothetical protein [Deltaproteobacteria bacterium]
MIANPPTRNPRLAPRPETTEMRVRFASRPALVAGLERARHEPWVRAARIDWARRELVLAVGGAETPHLRLVKSQTPQAAA